MKKDWVITPRTVEDLIEQLLVNRGVIDHRAFLHPDYRTLHDPMKLLHMDRLIERLQQAIATQERIAIFGDYDHDGTPAAALLSDGITACGGMVASVYIPTREEGYSLNKTVIDRFVADKIDLLITVDCGITNKPEIDYAAKQGMDCMVIDHHIVQKDKYPDAAIVVNPKQEGDTYPFKELCACGLAFKTIQALGAATGKISASQLKWYLDLVAISTICDMVPLVDENRILVHYGIIVLRQTRRLGLQKLLEVAAIDPATISSYTVGFGLGPRLNAPGRMERASIAYELLVSRDEKEANQLAQKLNQLNKDRQAELERVLGEADATVQRKRLHDRKVILVSGDGWNDGVVGLVAGRLMEKYNRPSIVLAGRADGLAKGSARSFGEFHLVDALQYCEPYLMKYGGHAKAAGLTLAKEHLQQLYDKLVESAEQKLNDEALRPRITIDAELRSDEVTLRTAQQLRLLEPHGYGNARPVLMLPNVEVIECKVIGSARKHLKLKLRTERGRDLDGVAFGLADRRVECPTGEFLDLVGMLDINEWQGRRTLQFKIIDWRTRK